MISDRLLDLMVRELVFLTPSVSVTESRDRRVAQMFSTTFRPEYHSYSEFLQKDSRERGLEYSARHATRAKPHLFVDPTQTSPFLSTRPKPPVCRPHPNLPFLVDPIQTSPVCRPYPNLPFLSTRINLPSTLFLIIVIIGWLIFASLSKVWNLSREFVWFLLYWL